eukprot:2995726-Pyramimonas_sp.AAC.1
MLDHYRAILASTDNEKERKFNVAQYKEKFQTSQGVEYTGGCKMMWEMEAIEFWESTPGGKMPWQVAEA